MGVFLKTKDRKGLLNVQESLKEIAETQHHIQTALVVMLSLFGDSVVCGQNLESFFSFSIYFSPW